MNYSHLAFKERSGPPVMVDYTHPIVDESGEPESLPLWDYVIDGRWWAEIEAAADGRPNPDGYWWGQVSPLGWTSREFEDEFLAQFERPGTPLLKSGRTLLGVCHIDADLLCGTLSCVVTHFKDYVEWAQFGHDWFAEGDLENIDSDVTWPDLRFRFESVQYERAFVELRERMAEYLNSDRHGRARRMMEEGELAQELAELPYPLNQPSSTLDL